MYIYRGDKWVHHCPTCNLRLMEGSVVVVDEAGKIIHSACAIGAVMNQEAMA